MVNSADPLGDHRFRLVLEAFNLDDSHYPAGLADFVRDDLLSLNFRAALTYLIIRGKYPNASKIEAIKAQLQETKFDEELRSLRRESSLRDRRRLLVASEGTLIDITRYSRTAEMSGIPRVVRNLVTSEVVKDSKFAVWSNQVFGPVQITKDGLVYFHHEVWGSSRNTHYLYFLIRKLFFSKTPKMARRKLLSLFLKALRRLLFGRLLIRMMDFQAPRACYIINPSNFVIPEVPDAINSELLRVWIENVGLQKVRCIVHDLLPLTHPEYFPKHAFNEHEEYVKLLRVCKILAVGTPVLARELDERLELPETDSRIKVLPLPVNLNSKGSLNQVAARPLLTFIGGYQARKGLRRLVDFLDSRDASQVLFKVAVVGAPNLLSGHDEARLYSRLLKQPEIYEVHDALDDLMFADLIRSSSAVLYISTAEGYGLPVLESLSLGVPVIVSRTTVNEHFSVRYGGLHLLSGEYLPEDLEALNEIASRGPLWDSLTSSIQTERLPLDVEKWAKDLLSL